MPTLTELESLLDVAPYAPPIRPRQKQQPRDSLSDLKNSKTREEAAHPARSLHDQEPAFIRLLRWLGILASNKGLPPKRQNPMQALKAGKRIIVVAVVDVGMISFYRFGQGAFHEWPMA